MATAVIDNAAMREMGASGAGNAYDFGRHGSVLCMSYTAVANADRMYVGPGTAFAAWENTSASVSNPVGIIVGALSPEIAVVETTATRDGNLWVFYRQGRGAPDNSLAVSNLHAPAAVNEVTRFAQALRMIVFSCASITNGQTSSLAMTGIKHLLVRPNASGSGQCDARFATDADRAIGKVTWSVTAGTKQCRLICLVKPSSGL